MQLKNEGVYMSNAKTTSQVAEHNDEPIPTNGPQFADPMSTPDPTSFVVFHGSDAAAYDILDKERRLLRPRPFPAAAEPEPTLLLAATYGTKGATIVDTIERAGQIVFHAVGDTGSVKSPTSQELVSDKMVSDFSETDPRFTPSFFYHLGDVVYSFGESKYYYDQFYDNFRNYPAPIFAVAGNHDGMVSPYSTTPTLQAFLDNFCTAGQPSHRTPESGELARTAQVQPGVYFTLESPFVRILSLYSNCLEDPGVISSQNGTYPEVTDAQLEYLRAALQRIKQENYTGALIIGFHHPPYVASAASYEIAGQHGGSPDVLADIDAICAEVGVWPHAVLSGHAHNYQRFTREQAGRQTPFVVAGNGGHGILPLNIGTSEPLRAPIVENGLSNGTDTVSLENYDDQDFGYLRVLANPQQLCIEYHSASDGLRAKAPNDIVVVDIATHTLAARYSFPAQSA